MPEISLKLQEVKVSFVDPEGGSLPILDIPNFSLEKGEQSALVGESGSGKTTLLNVIAGLLVPQTGTVEIDGIPISARGEAFRDRVRAAKIGLVFQTFNLVESLTALENVLIGMSFGGLPVDRNRGRELLVRIGLERRLHQRPARLSVGEQQRVAVARALAKKPALVLADEPTASVDLKNQEIIMNMLQDTCKEQQATLLVVTHQPEVSKRFGKTYRLSEFNRAAQLVPN